MCGDAFEIAPAQAAYPAIIVSLAAKVESAVWQRWKLRNRNRRQQDDRHPLAAGALAGNSRDAF
jgi:hypothetical protein